MKFLLANLYFLIVINGFAQNTTSQIKSYWHAIDGSNDVVFGITNNALFYKNKINPIDTIVAINNTAFIVYYKTAEVNKNIEIKVIDTNTIKLIDNNETQILKSTKTHKANYTRQNPFEFSFENYKERKIQLQGIWNVKNDINKILGANYITVKYKNYFTGENEFTVMPIDNNGIFKGELTIYKPQECVITTPHNLVFNAFLTTDSLQTFSITEIKVVTKSFYNENTSYAGDIMFLGSNGYLSNCYVNVESYVAEISKHLQRINNLSYESFRNKSVIEKLAKMNLYDSISKEVLKKIDIIIPTTKFGIWFNNHYKQKCYYSLAGQLSSSIKLEGYSRNENKNDSILISKAFNLFYRDTSTTPFLTDSYLMSLNLWFDKWRIIFIFLSKNYSPPYAHIKKRVANDYKDQLPKFIVEKFDFVLDSIMGNKSNIYNTDDDSLTNKLFNGDKNKFIEFTAYFKYIIDLVSKEAIDSIVYAAIQNEAFHSNLKYAMGLINLTKKDERRDELDLITLERFTVFNYFYNNKTKPYSEIIHKLFANILGNAVMSINFKSAFSENKKFNTDSEWFEFLKTKKNKLLILNFVSPKFTDLQLAINLSEFNILKGKYKQHNQVEFLTVVTFSELSNTKVALEYLKNIKTILDKDNYIVFAQDLIAVNSTNYTNYIDYDSYKAKNELAYLNFIPSTKTISMDSASKYYGEATTPENIINLNLFKPEFIKLADSIYKNALFTDRNIEDEKSWTLLKTEGNYYTYTKGVPNDLYDRNINDSVLNVISFKNNIFKYYNVILHLHIEKDKNTSYYSSSRSYFKKEFVNLTDEAFSYNINYNNKEITIYNSKNNLVKKYRIAFIDDQKMVLELLP